MFERNDRYLGVGIVLLGIICFVSASSWRALVAADPAGPGAIPRILSIGFILIGAILAVGSFLTVPKDAKKEGLIDRISLGIIVRLTVICVVYLIIFPLIGYLLSTPLLIAGIMLATGVRKRKTLIMVSLIMTLILFCVFYYILQVNLPLGFMKSFLSGIGLGR